MVQMQRPPSTSRQTPVMKSASSLARNAVALATSRGLDRRPRGMVLITLARASGVSWPPGRKSAMRPVSPLTGFTAQTQILGGANSIAIDFVRMLAAPFEPLYQVSPGRGRTPAVEAILII